MKILPIATNYTIKSNNINFKNNQNVCSSHQNENKSNSYFNSLIMGVLMGAAVYSCQNENITPTNNDNNTGMFFKRFEHVFNSDNIRKDTFLVKDVTDDNQPDIILFKNDGSKVIVDIANQEITDRPKKICVLK